MDDDPSVNQMKKKQHKKKLTEKKKPLNSINTAINFVKNNYTHR